MCLFLKFSVDKTSVRTKLARVDWLGGFLFIASLTSFLIAVSWGGSQFSWGSFHTIVPLTLGAVGIILPLALEFKIVKKPFIKRELFAKKDMIAACICAFINGQMVSEFIGPSELGQLTPA